MKPYPTKSKETKQSKTQLRVLKSWKKQRQIKINALTRPVYTSRNGQRRQYTSVEVPQLRINGKWLEAAGFEIGGQVNIDVSKGQLIISVVENDNHENSRA